ncbi:hypothetical protein [Mesonia sp. HuA40]|uniref:hypothetical protein n=1 Tax=Mesonia sp. HuA40 TaxID=2602761 RepID=UPI0011C9024E|nr:hypothetical protein [Mesonia sp. HuA40]TXK72656.1 hypothetical protein FT993_07450 [Mesonia sp. HuA40]
MKKQLEAELMSLAHRILQLRNRADVHELKAISAELHEKLSVLSFTEKHFQGHQPTIGKSQVEERLARFDESTQTQTKITPTSQEQPIEKTSESDHKDSTESKKDSQKEENTSDLKTSETSKSINQEKVETEASLKNEENTTDFGVHFDELPQFEPISTTKEQEKTNQPAPTKKEQSLPKQEMLFGSELAEFEPKKTHNNQVEQKKSLNQRLKQGIQIGLNDRLAYIKHLFDGDANDYNRVISQLNTLEHWQEAHSFLQEQVKPDYNHWENKEEIESRFMNAIENKFI